MTSLLNTCRWFPAGIHKLDSNRRVYINAFELLHVITDIWLVFSMTVAIELFNILFSIFLDKFQFSAIIITDKLTNFDEVLLKAYRITLCVIMFRMLDASCVR